MHPTSIAWTEYAGNPVHFIGGQDPVTGKARKGWMCTKISDGCTNCYAESLNMGNGRISGNLLEYNQTSLAKGQWTLADSEMSSWLKLEKPARIFVCDMTDLFHPAIPDSFRDEIFAGMERAPWHSYQVLTKRPEEALSYYGRKIEKGYWEFPKSMWLGVTVESSKYTHRIDTLRKLPASVRFISFEPLLADIEEVDLSGISWIIIGAESGKNRRPFEMEWAEDLLEQARNQNVSFFMKQESAFKPGQTKNIPSHLMIREFPEVMG